ncbi:MAG TPA: class II aldolase/adducin family protein [Thermohalobaculum sp.]|nr:class II aldolase/adducin family protein [Thermohalobaculum sp.]
MSLKRQIISTARAMNACGLNQGTSGNVSARRPDGKGMYVTPSGVPYGAMRVRDIVSMDWSGDWKVTGEGRKPSSEWRFHRDILSARPEFGAVVHAHPIHCTALAVHGRGIGPFHYMVALAGGRDIRCCGYATFGTQELSDLVLAALEERKACLMAHHGLIACGRDLEGALALAVEVETLAAQYIAALQLGEPPELTDAEIGEVLGKIRAGYGYGSGPEKD